MKWPPAGADHPGFGLFLGRFHPLVVHLPITLVLLVPLFELLGRSEPRSHLKQAAGFVLGLAAAAAILAAWDGWLLGWTGGYKGPVVQRHMYGGIWFATVCLAAASVRAIELSRPVSFSLHLPPRVYGGEAHAGRPAGTFRDALYAVLLAAAVGLMVWASHNGGSLSHGPTFLTEYFPRWLGGRGVEAASRRLPAPAGAPAPRTVYAAQIQPIFTRSCVACHGPAKHKANLRLDSYAGLMAGGDSGAEIDPWLPNKSELYRRITLPPDDDDFMPNNGKNLLTPAELAAIRAWILAGASDKQPLP